MRGWPLVELKRLLKQPPQYGASESGTQIDDQGWPRYVRITDIGAGDTLRESDIKFLEPDIARPFMLQHGDLLVARSGATVGKAFRYSNSFGPCAYAGYLIRFRFDSELADSRFIRHWADSSHYWEQISVGAVQATIENVNADRYKRLVMPHPSLPEQKRIAEFLDVETGRIDRLVAEYQRQLELLEEDFTASQEALTSAVSGRSVRLSTLYSDIDERAGANWSREDLLSVSSRFGVVPRSQLKVGMPEALDLSNYKRVEPGDVVVNRLWAFEGGVGVSQLHGVTSPDYLVLRPKPNVPPRFLHHLFRSKWFIAEMAKRVRGIGTEGLGAGRKPRVNEGDLRTIMVPEKTEAERLKIAVQLDALRDSTDALGTALDAQISTLKEFRQALISTAVSEGVEACEAVAA